MKYYIIAGEASGDLHGSNLIKELKKLDVNADMRVWGGDKMQQQGATLVKHYKDLAFMGFVEVLKHLRTIFKNIKFCKQDILEYKPDVLILIDYPGFNLRLVKWAKQNDLTVAFYISPQVWAWQEARVNVIKKYVDKLLVILPFEKEFYKKWNYEVEYVGHPLVEVVEDFKRNQLQVAGSRLQVEATAVSGQAIIYSDRYREANGNIIALLPGSREQEIKRKLPVMLATAEHFPGYEFIVAKAPGISEEFYNRFLSAHKNVNVVSGGTYALLMKAKAALVTSGTATLETALFEVPEVVCYKGDELSYQIAKRLVTLKYISLVNLIMDKEVVKELIQHDLTISNLRHELSELLTNENRLQQMRKDYTELKNILTKGGNASANAARSIYNMLEK